MRHAVRRILWIVPVLFVISVFTFWLLTAGAGWDVSRFREEPGSHPLFGHHELPRFFNQSPTSVRELTERAMASVAAGDEAAPAAALELARLGGAALPHVLPRLDGLEPKGRARVVLALGPIATRMKLSSKEELSDPDAAFVFWTRFWTDRAIDFRPVVVKRAVARLGEKSTAGRREDVRQLDTYALDELIGALPSVESEEDVKRARRLTTVAADVTEQPWRIGKDASVVEARQTVRRWRAWWLEHRADYVTFDGAERALAMLSETQYGRWATQAAQNRLGLSPSGETVLDLLLARAPLTLTLVALGLLGGWLGGIALGALAAARARRPLDLALSALAVIVASLPIAVLATWIAPSGSLGKDALAGLVMAAATGAYVSLQQRSAMRVALDQEYTRTARAFGPGPLRLARWSLRASSVAQLSLVGVELPALFTLAFVVEHALGLSGLGAATLAAVSLRDVAWLMALSLGVATLLSLAQILSDALLMAFDPRVRIALERRRGATL